MRCLAFLLFICSIPSFGFAQDLSAYSYDKHKNGINTKYYQDGDPSSGAVLFITYQIPLQNLKLNKRDKDELIKLVAKDFLDFKDPLAESNFRKAKKLLQKAKIKLRFSSAGSPYAVCKVGKSLSHLYTSVSVDNEKPLLGIEGYFDVAGTDPNRSTKSIACQSSITGEDIIPVVKSGDKLVLIQNGLRLTSAIFK